MIQLNEQSAEALSVIIDCLTREDELLRFLLAACEKQMDALKSNDHQAVEAVVGQVGNLLNGINSIEEERHQSKQILDAELGLAPDSKLADLLPHISDDYRVKLNTLRQNMHTKAEQLRAVNEINNIMTRQVLKFNETMIALLNPKENLTYGLAGVMNQSVPNSKRVLINKTV